MVTIKTEQRRRERQQQKPTQKKIKKYKGVRMRSWGSWVSEIRAPNQKTRIWLGSYSTAAAAARAYDAAFLCLRGAAAANNNLNFPISSYTDVPTPTDTHMCPKTVQRVAASAAATSPSLSPSSSPTLDHSRDSFYEDFNWCNDFDPLSDLILGEDYLLMFDQMTTTTVNYSYEEVGDIWEFLVT